MSFADANRTSIRVTEETVWGTTPASGISREVRLTSSSLAAAKETSASDEIRDDRMTASLIETAASSAGDINFEFSAGAQDEFLAAFVMGAWTRPMTRDFWKGTQISVTDTSEITVAGDDITGYLTAGHRILLKGFTDPANTGYFTIASVALSGADTIITIAESTLVAEAGSALAALFDANDIIVLNDATIESTATGFSSTGTPFAAAIAAGQLVVGQKIKVDGLTGVEGIYTITKLSDAAISVTPAPSAVVAAGAAVSVKGSMLRNPSDPAQIVQRQFSIETGFNVGQYLVQDGMVPGTFSLDVAAGSIMTGTVGFQGRATSLKQTTVLADEANFTVLATTPGEVVNATTNVGAVSKDGVELSTAIQSISISGDASLGQRAAVGSKFSRGVRAGRFGLTGSISAYFEDESFFEDFISHKTRALSFPIIDLDGSTYVFTLPAIKLSKDDIVPGGSDQDIMDAIDFTAIRDPNTDCMLQVDRFSPNIAD